MRIASVNMRLIPCLLLLFMCANVTRAATSDVPVQDTEGNQHMLSEYLGRGKWTVVNIWATGCPYCREELDALIDFHERHRDRDATVLGLTVQWPGFGYPDREDVYYFALDFMISYPLLLVDREVSGRLIGKPVNMIPLTFFYNPEGKLVHRINGMVTEDMLEAVIRKKGADYRIEWADVIPPEFRP